MKIAALFLSLIVLPIDLHADSSVWTYRANFIYDPWNTAIMPFVAKIPEGLSVAPENIRAVVKSADLAAFRAAAGKSGVNRLVKRATVSELKSDADVQHAKSYLFPEGQSVAVELFQTAAGYADKFGLLGLLQLVAKWQCAADEKCPERVTGKLEILIAKGGRIMKTETFVDMAGKPWIAATITYEIKVGEELRIVPLRSRMLEVQED